MKRKLIFAGFFLVLFSLTQAKEKIKKHRDQLRFGYGLVRSVEVYLVGPTGDLEHVRTDVFCNDSGGDRCRSSSLAYYNPTNELDVFDQEYTLVEKNAAESLLTDGDTQIDGGVVSGNISNTIQFYNTVTSQFYYRTFSYTWLTNADGSLNSSLDISDPF